MDTSPQQQPEFPTFTTPHLCAATPYDNLGFWDYPFRAGWEFPNGPWQPWIFSRAGSANVPSPRSEKMAFLQAWLFFGGLVEISAICGLDLELSEFFKSEGKEEEEEGGEEDEEGEEDEDEVSTAALNGLADRWITAAGGRECGEGVHAVYRIVSDCLRQWNPREGGNRTLLTFGECRVLMSISIFCRIVLLTAEHFSGFPLTLNGVAWHAWGDESLEGRVLLGFPGEMEMMEYSRTKLVRLGWCKSDIALLEGVHQKHGLFFASTLERPKMTTDHRRCNGLRCMADQVDEGYQTVHVTPECHCAIAEVAGGDLAGVLRRGKIPRILVTGSSGLGDGLRAEVAEDGPYVAMSHVWSHGLGNPHQNALPTCQLARLKTYTEELYEQRQDCPTPLPPNIALWIDTLCIPVDPVLVEDRKRAIIFLGKTYSDATAVLVLDRELQITSRTKSILEISLRIYCSGWMRRLWTLQEACLVSPDDPWKLSFRLLEGALPHATLDPHVLQSRRRQKLTGIPNARAYVLLYEHVLDAIEVRILPVHVLRLPNDLRTPFGTISAAVAFRSTSKAGDEPLCMAGLMGYDVARILSHDTAAARMAVFYTMLGEVPADLVFVPHMTKLTLPPFRWAPASILANEHHGFRYRQKPAGVVKEEEGLIINCAGFVVSAVAAAAAAAAAATRPLRTSRWIIHDPAAGPEADSFLWTPADMENITRARMEREFPERPALLFQRLDSMAGHVAVVDIEGERDGIYTVRIMHYASILPGWIPGRDIKRSSYRGSGFVPATEEEGPFDRVVGAFVDAVQRWCVT